MGEKGCMRLGYGGICKERVILRQGTGILLEPFHSCFFQRLLFYPLPLPCSSFLLLETKPFVCLSLPRDRAMASCTKDRMDHGFKRAVLKLGFQQSSVSVLLARAPGPCVMVTSCSVPSRAHGLLSAPCEKEGRAAASASTCTP